MSGPPVTQKWQRATTLQVKRKKSPSWVSMGQLYRELSEGYEYFLAARTRSGALKKRRK